MPDTHENMRRAPGLGGNLYDPHDNIIAGTAFLAAMYNRFGYPGLFAAYNAGPERYEAWLQHGTPLPGETLAYLSLAKYSYAAEPGNPSLFANLRRESAAGSDTSLGNRTAERAPSAVAPSRNGHSALGQTGLEPNDRFHVSRPGTRPSQNQPVLPNRWTSAPMPVLQPSGWPERLVTQMAGKLPFICPGLNGAIV
jgi:Transglycosylase SLT domain